MNKNEMPTQDLEDIEDGTVKPNCFHCGKKQHRHIKVMPSVDSFGNSKVTKTKNEIGVCQNIECFRYLDLKQMPSWIRP